jgi:hypothetical protein
MCRVLLFGIVAAILIVDGYVHGRWTERWGGTADAALAAERLPVPMTIGEWQGQAKDPLSERETTQAGFRAHFIRVYTNRRSGAAATVLLACGRPGPLSVHTPDVCYRGLGFQSFGAPSDFRMEAENGEVLGELRKCQFGKPDSGSPVQLRVVWAWNSNGTWKAPSNPRIAFAGAPALYKLYVIHELIPNDQRTEQIGSEFLKDLLPELNKSLFPKTVNDDS